MGWKDFLSIAIQAAPYIAAIPTGGSSLAFAPATAAAAGALKGSEGGLKGALIGGTLGGVTGLIPGAVSQVAGQAAGQAGAPLIAENALKAAIAKGAVDPAAAASIPAVAGAGALTAPPGAAAGMPIWQRFMSNPKALEAASKMAMSVANKSEANRLHAEQSQGTNLRRLQQAEYVAGGGTAADPYGFITPPGEGSIREAAQLRDQLKKQLRRRTTPGALETVFDVAAPALGVWSAMMQE